MGFMSRVKAAMRDSETIREIQSIPLDERPVVVYAEDDYTWNQLEGYIDAIIEQQHLPVVYVTADAEDPVLERRSGGLRPFAITESVQKFVPGIDSPVFLTTMPDLDRFHVKRPTAATCVYAFHSLNSIHASYREGAFDAYDVFLCVGPYQVKELTERFEQIGKGDFTLAKTGYYKLDRIAAAYRDYEKVHAPDTTVLIAPSWGKDNLLESVGSEIIGSIADLGVRTVVRPHPAFFESIYPGGTEIVAALEAVFADRPNVVFEKSITSENSFLEADLMVSDWSGAAFEYSLGTDRPTLFIDVARKVMNDRWRDIDMVPFEERIRDEVGTVLPTDEAADAGSAAASLLESAADYESQIAEVRGCEIYNFGSSASAGARTVASLLDEP